MKNMVMNMQCRGKIKKIARDFSTNGILVTLSLTDISIQALQTIAALDDLMVEMKRYRKKRSVNANSYYWELVGKLAKANRITNNAQHNLLLRDYGSLERFDGQLLQIMIPDTEEGENRALESSTVHLKPTSHVKVSDNGTTYRSYVMIKGSSTYDSQEMSRLIDGTVQEAKQMGIETLPPEELKRMKEDLKKHEAKKCNTT